MKFILSQKMKSPQSFLAWDKNLKGQQLLEFLTG